MVVSYALNKDSMQATCTLLAKLRSEVPRKHIHPSPPSTTPS